MMGALPDPVMETRDSEPTAETQGLGPDKMIRVPLTSHKCDFSFTVTRPREMCCVGKINELCYASSNHSYAFSIYSVILFPLFPGIFVRQSRLSLLINPKRHMIATHFLFWTIVDCLSCICICIMFTFS